MPYINGKLLIYNRGKLVLGKKNKFNSTVYSNFVGLNKPCTIQVEEGASLYIGDYSGFSGVSIYCREKITIGRYLFCGGNVSIWDSDFHPLNYEKRRDGILGTFNAPIIIGDDVFIGANSIILKGVNIGDRAIIGAGSVVKKNITCDEIWAGNPAKKISKLINI
jgi:acetyltransferase-like isoleucine patch superfamily enzyme